MFTGIIRHQGKLAKHTGGRLTIAVPRGVHSRLKPGGSIAVNGVCLTVETKILNSQFAISIMPETKKATTLGKIPVGSRVNLELPLRLGDQLDGHLVTGHVDGVGTVKTVHQHGNSRSVTITAPRTLLPYLAPKGSIAVDGVSLTIQSTRGGTFTVGLIPETLKRTTLGELQKGDIVNVEADIIARYLEHYTKTKSVKRKVSYLR